MGYMGQTNKTIGNLKRSARVVTMFCRDINTPQILGQTDANRVSNSRVQSLVVSERTWMKRHKLGRCRGKSGHEKCTKCLWQAANCAPSGSLDILWSFDLDHQSGAFLLQETGESF